MDIQKKKDCPLEIRHGYGLLFLYSVLVPLFHVFSLLFVYVIIIHCILFSSWSPAYIYTPHSVLSFVCYCVVIVCV